MASMEVEVISRETIRPSSPTPPHLTTYKLSLFDQLSPTLYTPITLYYPMSDGNHCIKEISIRLKDSLSETLSRFYPLAGRFKDGVSIDCNDEGALFTEAKISGHLSEFLNRPNLLLLEKFLPCPQFSQVPMNTVIQVAIQLNIFACGGIAISGCFLHKIVDGATMGAFLKCWAAFAIGSDDKAVCPDYSTASQVFPPTNQSLQGDDMSLLNVNWLNKQGKGVRRRFVFDAAAISALKAKATSQLVPNPSRVAVVSSFMWKSTMAASKVALGSQHQRPSILGSAVNIRPRTVPPLSEYCIGNMAWQAVATHKPPPGAETELKDLVSQFKKAVARINGDYMKSLQGDDRFQVISKFREEVEEIFSEEKPDTYLYSSWCNFGLNEVDFGWGRPIWISNTGSDISPIFVEHGILIDTSCGDGIEAWVLLDEIVMAILESDPQFLAFASLNPNISTPVAR